MAAADAPASRSRYSDLRRLRLTGSDTAELAGLDAAQCTELVSWLLKRDSEDARLRRLALAHCSFGDDGATDVADAVAAGAIVDALACFSCGIGNSGAFAIGLALSVASLRVLELRDNPAIGPEGAAAIARSLPLCPTLQVLDLSGTHVGDHGATLFAHVVTNCSDVDTASQHALATPLRSSSSLRQLVLQHCSLTHFGATVLATAIAHGCSLQSLDLSGNLGIGDLGMHALAAAICAPCDGDRLTKLALRACGVGRDGAIAMAAAAFVHACHQPPALLATGNALVLPLQLDMSGNHDIPLSSACIVAAAFHTWWPSAQVTLAGCHDDWDTLQSDNTASESRWSDMLGAALRIVRALPPALDAAEVAWNNEQLSRAFARAEIVEAAALGRRSALVSALQAPHSCVEGSAVGHATRVDGVSRSWAIAGINSLVAASNQLHAWQREHPRGAAMPVLPLLLQSMLQRIDADVRASHALVQSPTPAKPIRRPVHSAAASAAQALASRSLPPRRTPGKKTSPRTRASPSAAPPQVSPLHFDLSVVRSPSASRQRGLADVLEAVATTASKHNGHTPAEATAPIPVVTVLFIPADEDVAPRREMRRRTRNRLVQGVTTDIQHRHRVNPPVFPGDVAAVSRSVQRSPQKGLASDRLDVEPPTMNGRSPPYSRPRAAVDKPADGGSPALLRKPSVRAATRAAVAKQREQNATKTVTAAHQDDTHGRKGASPRVAASTPPTSPPRGEARAPSDSVAVPRRRPANGTMPAAEARKVRTPVATQLRPSPKPTGVRNARWMRCSPPSSGTQSPLEAAQQLETAPAHSSPVASTPLQSPPSRRPSPRRQHREDVQQRPANDPWAVLYPDDSGSASSSSWETGQLSHDEWIDDSDAFTFSPAAAPAPKPFLGVGAPLSPVLEDAVETTHPSPESTSPQTSAIAVAAPAAPDSALAPADADVILVASQRDDAVVRVLPAPAVDAAAMAVSDVSAEASQPPTVEARWPDHHVDTPSEPDERSALAAPMTAIHSTKHMDKHDSSAELRMLHTPMQESSAADVLPLPSPFLYGGLAGAAAPDRDSFAISGATTPRGPPPPPPRRIVWGPKTLVRQHSAPAFLGTDAHAAVQLTVPMVTTPVLRHYGAVNLHAAAGHGVIVPMLPQSAVLSNCESHPPAVAAAMEQSATGPKLTSPLPRSPEAAQPFAPTVASARAQHPGPPSVPMSATLVLPEHAAANVHAAAGGGTALASPQPAVLSNRVTYPHGVVAGLELSPSNSPRRAPASQPWSFDNSAVAAEQSGRPVIAAVTPVQPPNANASLHTLTSSATIAPALSPPAECSNLGTNYYPGLPAVSPVSSSPPTPNSPRRLSPEPAPVSPPVAAPRDVVQPQTVATTSLHMPLFVEDKEQAWLAPVHRQVQVQQPASLSVPTIHELVSSAQASSHYNSSAAVSQVELTVRASVLPPGAASETAAPAGSQGHRHSIAEIIALEAAALGLDAVAVHAVKSALEATTEHPDGMLTGFLQLSGPFAAPAAAALDHLPLDAMTADPHTPAANPLRKSLAAGLDHTVSRRRSSAATTTVSAAMLARGSGKQPIDKPLRRSAVAPAVGPDAPDAGGSRGGSWTFASSGSPAGGSAAPADSHSVLRRPLAPVGAEPRDFAEPSAEYSQGPPLPTRLRFEHRTAVIAAETAVAHRAEGVHESVVATATQLRGPTDAASDGVVWTARTAFAADALLSSPNTVPLNHETVSPALAAYATRRSDELPQHSAEGIAGLTAVAAPGSTQLVQDQIVSPPAPEVVHALIQSPAAVTSTPAEADPLGAESAAAIAVSAPKVDDLQRALAIRQQELTATSKMVSKALAPKHTGSRTPAGRASNASAASGSGPVVSDAAPGNAASATSWHEALHHQAAVMTMPSGAPTQRASISAPRFPLPTPQLLWPATTHRGPGVLLSAPSEPAKTAPPATEPLAVAAESVWAQRTSAARTTPRIMTVPPIDTTVANEAAEAIQVQAPAAAASADAAAPATSRERTARTAGTSTRRRSSALLAALRAPHRPSKLAEEAALASARSRASSIDSLSLSPHAVQHGVDGWHAGSAALEQPVFATWRTPFVEPSEPAPMATSLGSQQRRQGSQDSLRLLPSTPNRVGSPHYRLAGARASFDGGVDTHGPRPWSPLSEGSASPGRPMLRRSASSQALIQQHRNSVHSVHSVGWSPPDVRPHEANDNSAAPTPNRRSLAFLRDSGRQFVSQSARALPTGASSTPPASGAALASAWQRQSMRTLLIPASAHAAASATAEANQQTVAPHLRRSLPRTAPLRRSQSLRLETDGATGLAFAGSGGGAASIHGSLPTSPNIRALENPASGTRSPVPNLPLSVLRKSTA